MFAIFPKIRTMNVEACSKQKFKNIQKDWNPKKLRTFEDQTIFTGPYKEECITSF